MTDREIIKTMNWFASQVSDIIPEENWDEFSHYLCQTEEKILKILKEVREDGKDRKSTNKKTA